MIFKIDLKLFQSDNTFFLRFSKAGPKVFLSSNRLMAEEKQNITIACNASGQPHPSITWLKSVGSLPRERAKVKNGALTIYDVRRNDGGIYICKANNMLGSASAMSLVVTFPPLRFKVIPPKEVTPDRFGSTILLPCSSESDLRTKITWTKDGKSSLPADTYFLPNGTMVLLSIKKTHVGTYTCRVTNALSTIEARVKINSPRIVGTSCSVIRKYVGRVNGNYVIDPDGEGGLAPFTVFCDMTDKSHYTGASLTQLAKLTRVSLHCEQFIKYECSASVLLSPHWGDPYGWWVSRDSTKMTYWGGASISRKCACGMTNSCADSGFGCNCDKNDYVWREDSGLLTDKTKLPVKQLRFGDAGGNGQEGYHTLGKLKCYGTA